MTEQPINLKDLSEAQKDALIIELFARLRVLEARVKELEGSQKKDSSNSGKPPSQDGLKKKPRNNSNSLRNKSNKQQGGQPGHKGHTLRQTDSPDIVEDHLPCSCGHCGHDLSNEPAGGYDRRQVYDLPPLHIEVTEHRAHYKLCPDCLNLNRGEFPAQVDYPVQYGSSTKATAVYLKAYQLLPYDRMKELFADVFNHDLSTATLLNAEQTCHTRLQSVEEAVRRALCQVPVVNFDESGLRVEGKLHWLHTASTPYLTWYMVHPKRGRDAMDEANILPDFKGIAVHDALQSYFQYTLCAHALCNAHHLRELKLMFEHYGQLWAAAMAALLRDMHRVVGKHREVGKNGLNDELATEFERCYTDILQTALEEIPSLPDPPPDKRGRKKQHPAKNLYDRLLKHKDAALRFMRDFRVPFDNNQAERDIRMIKTQQKISGTFRKMSGAKVFCQVRGYISTAKKQGKNVLEALRSVLDCAPWVPELA